MQAATFDGGFGLIVIGDEILFGKRQDRHFEHFRETLAQRGFHLLRCWVIGDEACSLTRQLAFSMQENLPVFVCGGIGATPDDLTRQCAAEAAGVALSLHEEARQLIEGQFGEAAYPTRIKMAELPQGCDLIPNPYNRIPGFFIRQHYFLPGFPQMSWPMANWVLDQFFSTRAPLREVAVKVYDTPESSLVPVMQLFAGLAEVKMFSLPRLGEQRFIELGFRGYGDVQAALAQLKTELQQRNMPFRDNDET